MPEQRFPCSKPKSTLTVVWERKPVNPGDVHTIRYTTAKGKLFDRDEAQGRGVVWFQVVNK